MVGNKLIFEVALPLCYDFLASLPDPQIIRTLAVHTIRSLRSGKVHLVDFLHPFFTNLVLF